MEKHKNKTAKMDGIDVSSLTHSERAAIELYLRGLQGKEIAKQLGKSLSTVSTQKKSALAKLGVGSLVELFVTKR
jgi:two-component system capsular synthesis response regulator RcsB